MPVMESIPERYTNPITRRRIATLANISDDDWMQDWPLEVADPKRVREFVALLQRANDDDDRFALMELCCTRSTLVFAQLIVYWSCTEDETGAWHLTQDPDEQFSITPLMREVLDRVAAAIGITTS
jgi:hypothetical protein